MENVYRYLKTKRKCLAVAYTVGGYLLLITAGPTNYTHQRSQADDKHIELKLLGPDLACLYPVR
jgi:hypothetical protein